MLSELCQRGYSSSSASLSAMLKYLSSYTFLSLLEAITRSQSRTLCFLRNFFVKYLRYLHMRRRVRCLAMVN